MGPKRLHMGMTEDAVRALLAEAVSACIATSRQLEGAVGVGPNGQRDFSLVGRDESKQADLLRPSAK